MGGGSRVEGTREPWGTLLGKLREYKGVVGSTRLPTPLGPPLLQDILMMGLGFRVQGLGFRVHVGRLCSPNRINFSLYA